MNQQPIDWEDFDWNNWTPTEKAVLLFLIVDENILLIHKKRGLGTGKINGPGGRLEAGETFSQAALRETLEETHLRVDDIEEMGELSFVFVDGYSLYAKVFIARSYSGVPTETDEAAPFWCPLNQIPWDKMWADDPLWLPLVLKGDYIRARFVFDGDTMLTKKVESHPHGAIPVQTNESSD